MKLKKILLSLATVIFSGLAWFFFGKIFSSTSIFFGNGLNWAMFFLFTAISYSFAFLVSLYRDKTDFILTTLLSSLWLLVFLGVTVKTLLCVAGLFIALQVLMEFPIGLERTMNLGYFSTAYSKIALVCLALIAISSLFLQSTVATSISETKVASRTSEFAWPYISRYLSEFESDLTVNEYLKSQFAEQGYANPDRELIAEQRVAISNQVGMDLKGNEKMSDIGKGFVAQRISDLMKQFNMDKVGFYVLFFSLLVLLPLGRIFYAFMAYLVYQIFKASGLVSIKETEIITKSLEI